MKIQMRTNWFVDLFGHIFCSIFNFRLSVFPFAYENLANYNCLYTWCMCTPVDTCFRYILPNCIFPLAYQFYWFCNTKIFNLFCFSAVHTCSVNLLKPIPRSLCRVSWFNFDWLFQRAVRFAISNATNRLNQLDRLAAQIIAEENLEIPLFFRFVATGMESRQKRKVVKTKRWFPTTFPVPAHHVLVNKLAGR